MKDIITANELPVDEKIYFRKDWAGYRVVYPIKNEDGTINWFNLLFGGKRNLVFLIFVLLTMALILFSYNHDVDAMRDVSANPCKYCVDCVPKVVYKYPQINIEEINITNAER